ncbi:MAG TPA: TonB-dependent receptor [Vicinamibacterales bacterium]|nr:TonB-dependent receptor [Vicinamibacterales bacterium]
MNRRWTLLVLLVAIAFASAAPQLAAQGLQTGVLTGTVTSEDDLALPGATVVISSPALQGTRETVTDQNGNYVLRGLPPGEYTVTFRLEGMAEKTEKTTIRLGRTTPLHVALAVAAVEETVQVVADAAPVVTSTVVGANYRAEEINQLPASRNPQGIAELAPGLTDNTPNSGQLAISGGFAYDNVFLIDGVDVNDNFFGSPHNLFIEDAVEETQVLTSGISAEYGRFSGGVVNLVTRRGGNRFSGSYRLNLQNPAWTDETPFETTERREDVQMIHEGTFGGPIVQDHLWFFLAGRAEDTETPFNLAETAIPGAAGVDDKRLEVKLTGTFARSHTIQGGYIHNNTRQRNVRGIIAAAIDPNVLFDRRIPQRLGVVSWNGVLSSRLFATAQYSQKKFGFRNSGGTGTDLALDSPFRTLGATGLPQGLLYNAPYFDGNDPEDRDNRQLTGSLSYFLTTPTFGSHDLKGGFEWFRSLNTGGNGQSPTGYVFWTDYLRDADGKPAFDDQGRIIPLFIPEGSWVFRWIAQRGAEIQIDTTSFYLQDRWAVHKRLTLDLGMRYEKVRSEATGDIIGADTDTWVPRLAATYDVRGDGTVLAQATYGHYSGRHGESFFASNTEVGNPSVVIWEYHGPEGQGLDFAPGTDLSNYPTVLFGSFGTANVFLEPGLSAPVAREFTLSIGSELGRRSYVKATYVQRKTTGFIDDYITADNGQTEVIREGINFGTLDNIVYRNAPDDLRREYRALVLQARHQLTDRWLVSGHYTAQLRNHGNYEGEAGNQPGVPTFYGDYPEATDVDRISPFGRLDEFQRHKLRLWTIYDLRLGAFGHADLSALWRYNSGLTYSLAAEGVPVTDIQEQIAEQAGYATTPHAGEQDLFFGERGSGTFEGCGLVDFGVTYTFPVRNTVRPYFKFEVLNAFNNQKLTAWDVTVEPDFDGPKDELGLPLNYIEGENFGEATAETHYPTWRTGGFTGSRTFLLAFGVRF